MNTYNFVLQLRLKRFPQQPALIMCSFSVPEFVTGAEVLQLFELEFYKTSLKKSGGGATTDGLTAVDSAMYAVDLKFGGKSSLQFADAVMSLTV